MRAVIVAFVLGLAIGPARAESGIASVYSYGRLTADGEHFDPRAMTAAHRTLPFGTLVRVTTDAGRSILVRINDRGPYVRVRIIDLTPAAARALGFSGLIRVTVEPLGPYRPRHHDFGFF